MKGAYSDSGGRTPGYCPLPLRGNGMRGKGQGTVCASSETERESVGLMADQASERIKEQIKYETEIFRATLSCRFRRGIHDRL